MQKIRFKRYAEHNLRGRWVEPNELHSCCFTSTWQREEEPEIEVKFINSENDLDEICLYDSIRGVDWRKEILVYVSLGYMPSGGFAIQVRDVIKENNRLLINVALKSPSPQDFVTMALTCPFDLVKVPREEVDFSSTAKVALTTGNKELKAVLI